MGDAVVDHRYLTGSAKVRDVLSREPERRPFELHNFRRVGRFGETVLCSCGAIAQWHPEVQAWYTPAWLAGTDERHYYTPDDAPETAPDAPEDVDPGPPSQAAWRADHGLPKAGPRERHPMDRKAEYARRNARRRKGIGK